MNTSEQAARVAAIFDRVADTYDAVGVPWFTPIAEELVRLADPRPGESALDVGCGRGAALLPLADAVGTGGRVTGIDLSANMIEATRAAVTGRDATHVDLHIMDASSPELPTAGYDLVVSSLMVFFLPDPLSALTSWRRLLVRPGGRLAISTFADRDPAWDAVDAVFRPYLPARLLDARTSGATGPFASDAGVEELVTAAGYTDARTVRFPIEVVFADAAAWHRFTWSHGQRAMWEAVPETDRDGVLQAAAARLEQARGDDGLIRLGQRVRFTLATTG